MNRLSMFLASLLATPLVAQLPPNTYPAPASMTHAGGSPKPPGATSYTVNNGVVTWNFGGGGGVPIPSGSPLPSSYPTLPGSYVPGSIPAQVLPRVEPAPREMAAPVKAQAVKSEVPAKRVEITKSRGTMEGILDQMFARKIASAPSTSVEGCPRHYFTPANDGTVSVQFVGDDRIVRPLVEKVSIRSLACKDNHFAFVEGANSKAVWKIEKAPASTGEGVVHVFDGLTYVDAGLGDEKYKGIALRGEGPTPKHFRAWRLNGGVDDFALAGTRFFGAVDPSACPDYELRRLTNGAVNVLYRTKEGSTAIVQATVASNQLICRGKTLALVGVGAKLEAGQPDPKEMGGAPDAKGAMLVFVDGKLAAVRSGTFERFGIAGEGAAALIVAESKEGAVIEMGLDGVAKARTLALNKSCPNYSIIRSGDASQFALVYQGEEDDDVTQLGTYQDASIIDQYCTGGTVAFLRKAQDKTQLLLFRDGQKLLDRAGTYQRFVEKGATPRVQSENGTEEVVSDDGKSLVSAPARLANCANWRLTPQGSWDAVTLEVKAKDQEAFQKLGMLQAPRTAKCIDGTLGVVAADWNPKEPKAATHWRFYLFNEKGFLVQGSKDSVEVSEAAGAFRVWNSDGTAEDVRGDGTLVDARMTLPPESHYQLSRRYPSGVVYVTDVRSGARLAEISDLSEITGDREVLAWVAGAVKMDGKKLSLNADGSTLSASDIAKATVGTGYVLASGKLTLAVKPPKGVFTRVAMRELDPKVQSARFWTEGEKSAATYAIDGAPYARPMEVDETCKAYRFLPIDRNTIEIGLREENTWRAVGQAKNIVAIACADKKLAIVADSFNAFVKEASKKPEVRTNVTEGKYAETAGGLYLLDAGDLTAARKAPGGKFSAVTLAENGAEFILWPAGTEKAAFTVAISTDGKTVKAGRSAPRPDTVASAWEKRLAERFREDTPPKAVALAAITERRPEATELDRAALLVEGKPSKTLPQATLGELSAARALGADDVVPTPVRWNLPPTPREAVDANASAADRMNALLATAKVLTDSSLPSGRDVAWTGLCVTATEPDATYRSSLHRFADVPRSSVLGTLALRRFATGEAMPASSDAMKTIHDAYRKSETYAGGELEVATPPNATWKETMFRHGAVKVGAVSFIGRFAVVRELLSETGDTYLTMGAYCDDKNGCVMNDLTVKYGFSLGLCVFDKRYEF